MSETTTASGLADPAARRKLMSGVEPEPGSAKPDAILKVDNITRHFGGITAVDVGPPRGAARDHHRADRAQRRRQDDVLQPDHRLRPPVGRAGGALELRRRHARPDLGVEGRQVRHGPHLPAHQGAEPDDGDGQHDAGRPEPGRREPRQVPVQAVLGRAGEGDRGQGPRAARAVQPAREAQRLRRLALRRPAQAARDGPGPDERPEDDHARRADGGREPGAHPVAARPHPVACATRA